MVEWHLDQIEDADAGEALDRLAHAADVQERLAKDVARVVEALDARIEKSQSSHSTRHHWQTLAIRNSPPQRCRAPTTMTTVKTCERTSATLAVTAPWESEAEGRALRLITTCPRKGIRT